MGAKYGGSAGKENTEERNMGEKEETHKAFQEWTFKECTSPSIAVVATYKTWEHHIRQTKEL